MKRKHLLLPVLLFLFTACSTVNTEIYKSGYEPKRKSVYLKIKNDSWNLENSITNRIEKLGFTINRTSSESIDIFAYVDYETFWDVVHQTFNHFEMSLVDARTNEVLLKSRYVGKFGFNGCEAALDLVFEDIASKL